MKSKTDGDLSLDSYWKKHCISIAKDRHWAIQTGDQYSFETCATLRQYDDYIRKVAGCLDMPIAEITPANILRAVSDVAITSICEVDSSIIPPIEFHLLCHHLRHITI